MAKLNIMPPEDLMNRLSNFSNKLDDIAPKILDAGIRPLEKQIRQNAAKHIRTGAMVGSIKEQKSKKDKKGVWRKRVDFVGYDKWRKSTPSDPRGVPNARKAMSLEYGTVNQPAEPFIRPAVIQSEGEVAGEMQQAFDWEVGKI